MSDKKKSRRVALKKIEILSVVDQGHVRTQAKAVLELGNSQYIGRSFVELDEEEMLDAVARASLNAIKDIVGNGIEFTLKIVSKLRPRFLNHPLIVVLIDCKYEDLEMNLTGACITVEEKVLNGVASAVLDGTNRIIGYILDMRDLEKQINEY
ncbi:MAG: hypothetical protein JNN15_20135 [Blastocatellia bacterium]|nr:hypothetical protein [Blastocatellia bacterium]